MECYIYTKGKKEKKIELKINASKSDISKKKKMQGQIIKVRCSVKKKEKGPHIEIERA